MPLPFYNTKRRPTYRSIRNSKKGGVYLIVICTGIEEIDKEIQNELKDASIAYYSDYLIENNDLENQTVIISKQAIEGDFQEFLFKLKQKNIRVILLLKEEKQEETKIALQLGVFDIVYGNFYVSQIKEIIEKPRTFKDVSSLYKKIFNIKLRKRIRKNTNSFFSGK